MGVSLSIKDVPEALAQRLRERAAANHRSLQRELMAIIERAAIEESPIRAGSQRHAGGPCSGRGKAIEQIAAEHLALYPEPFTQAPRAVDMVREDRSRR